MHHHVCISHKGVGKWGDEVDIYVKCFKLFDDIFSGFTLHLFLVFLVA